jgi:hypothetical protein
VRNSASATVPALLRWIVYWLVLPHLLIILMWPIGGPPMTPLLTLSGLSALLISLIPWKPVQRLLLLALMVIVTACYVCAMFNISPFDVSILPAFLREVHPWKSPAYVIGALVVLLGGAIALLKAPAVPRLTSLRPLTLALVAVVGLGQLDSVASATTSGSYNASPGAGDPFHAATGETGLGEPPGDGRHVVIIIVEGLGMPTARVEKALFDADWDRPHWRQHYEVSHGLVPYYGSTTNAELRELCGTWGQYFRFNFAKASCLPGKYRAAGYQSTAMHAFDGSFFDRTTWYPLLGFDQIHFAADLEAEGARPCGGVFPGACDRDIPQLLADRLKQAGRPQLIYWLTLNTHLPVIADPKLGTEHCDLGEASWRAENSQLCRMFLLHHQLADAIDTMVMDRALPPADVLIVGDHMPPFSTRDQRTRFRPKEVPWVLLRWKGESGMGKRPARRR